MMVVILGWADRHAISMTVAGGRTPLPSERRFRGVTRD
jgi:hypothetical protein